MEDGAIYEEDIPEVNCEENKIEEEFDTDSRDDDPWLNTAVKNKQQTAALGDTTY